MCDVNLFALLVIVNVNVNVDVIVIVVVLLFLCYGGAQLVREVGVNLFTLLVTDRAGGASTQYGAGAWCSMWDVWKVFFMQLNIVRNHRDIAHG